MAFFGGSDTAVSYGRIGNEPTGLVSFPGSSYIHKNVPQKHTKSPITTGSSVLGVVFNGGVMIAADTLGSFGRMARYLQCPRVIKVNENIILGAGGDYADFQHVEEVIRQKIVDEECRDDGFIMKPKAMYNWLTHMLYTKRSKFDPLWNTFVIGGLEDGVPFLGTVDKLGAAYQDEVIATGFGLHLAIPLMRAALDQARPQGGLTQEQAVQLIQKCLEVLYYRDGRSWPKYQVAVITKDGVNVNGPFTLDSNWDVAAMVQGFE